MASMPPELPRELARLLAAGEAERTDAWAAFVRCYTNLILGVARELGGGSDAAMDRYAFVLERLEEDGCRRLRAYPRPDAGDFVLWLSVVVRRLCLDHHRARYGRSRPTSETTGIGRDDRLTRRRLVDLVAAEVDLALLAAPGGTPEGDLALAERARALARALDGLDARDRLLLRFRFAEELPAREIASLMAFPTLFHVYRRLDVVLQGLKRSLLAQGVDDAQA